MSDPLTPQEKPIRLWRRVVIALVALVVLTAVLGVIGNRYDHARTVGALKALTDQLDRDDPNWRLADLEANREVIPEDENSARVVTHVITGVPGNWSPLEGYAIVASPEEQLGAADIADLEKVLNQVAFVLPDARRLAEMPRGRFRVNFTENPIDTLVTEGEEAQNVCQVLRLDALLLAQKGDIDAALRSGRALINTARAVGDEPFLNSQLMRASKVIAGCASIERSLGQGVASEKELQAVQRLLTLEEPHPTLRIAARGLRALHFEFYEKVVGGRIDETMISRHFNLREPTLWEEMFGRTVSRREQIADLRLITRYIESTRLPEHEQAAAQAPLDVEMGILARESMLSLMAFESGLGGETMRRKTMIVRCMMVAVAIERYRLAHGKWPETLDRLKPMYLPKIPLDPHDGKPLRFLRTADGVLVYSVGEDRVDNGGKVQPPAEDQGVLLFDVSKRRQPAKPRPIVPKEEIPP